MRSSHDLVERLARIGASTQPSLGDLDGARLAFRFRQKRKRRIVIRSALGGASLALLLPLFVARHSGENRHALAPVQPVPSLGAPLTTPLTTNEGSLVTPLSPNTTVTLKSQATDSVQWELDQGRARFQVSKGHDRLFMVSAGPVRVTVIGTVFVVERIADRVGVSVEEGMVWVEWPRGRKSLAAGEEDWFPRQGTSSARDGGLETIADPRQVTPRSARPTPSPRTKETCQELLDRADEARANGKPREAADWLEHALKTHAQDPRAPLAAFTLGRVLLLDLKEPRDAATAFARARALAPTGPFAEDSLAREAEAWTKAGEGEKARDRALEYTRLYPRGSRLENIKALRVLP